jgi:acyl-[acyl-carrier-protein]-phospholipid O-acyltransferase/long-chain-fatty-acid--[acyl-carrier-protein] ligase
MGMKSILRFVLRLLFGFRVYNDAVLKTPGPLLLIPNHTSWIDWLFIYVLLDDDWRFVSSSTTAQASWVHRRIMLNKRTLPVDTSSPYAVKRMAEMLQQGGKLVLFSEGRISLTGTLGKIFDGTGFLLNKTKAKAICCYLRGAYRLPFSPNSDRKRWFPRVSAHFSEVLTPLQNLKSLKSTERRMRLSEWLRDRLIAQQFETEQAFSPRNVLAAVIENASWQLDHPILEDTTNQTLTYRRFLAGTRVLAGAWKKTLPSDAVPIGVLLPNVNAAAIVFFSLWSAGKVPAPLNYSGGVASMIACAKIAGIKQIITSRLFLERAHIDAAKLTEAGLTLIWVDEVGAGISTLQRLTALIAVTFFPRHAVHVPQSLEDTAVILFTSGSEGVPKGVALTHANLTANIHQMLAVNDFQDTDRLFNCLPIFHSFSLTVGTLLPLVRGMYVYLYPSPVHYRVIPTMFYDKNCTIFLSTNTFLNGYARRAHPYDFRSLRYLFAGAEKIQEATAELWARRFGVRILEAYGTTECSPALAANTPLAPKHGSVGRFLPGVEYRLDPVEGVADGGRLFVRGPNIMKGYLNPEANAPFQALGGWHDTGDIVQVDAHGFLEIKGRLKRFAKISGEMVSLTAVEEALSGAFPHYGQRFQVVVITKPDAGKGEALVAVTNDTRLKIEEMRPVIQAKGLSNLAVPAEIRVLPEIPKLGTGKVDYKELQKAAEKTA